MKTSWNFVVLRVSSLSVFGSGVMEAVVGSAEIVGRIFEVLGSG